MRKYDIVSKTSFAFKKNLNLKVMGNKIKGKDLIGIGFPKDNTMNIALGLISRYRKKETKERVLAELKNVLREPDTFMGDGTWGKIAEGLIAPVEVAFKELNFERAPFLIYGENEVDENTKYQFYNALKLPISVQGALMPDAHYGYGLPIGGVLAKKCSNSLWRWSGYRL